MKKLKKVFSLLFALVMALAMNVTVFASGDGGEGTVNPNPPATSITYTITINNSKTGHTYNAYQIFSGDLSGNVLSNVNWGNGVNADNLLTALKADGDIGTQFADCKTAADVANVLVDFNSTNVDKFAEIVSGKLNVVAGTADTPTNAKYEISGLSAGYYFVKDANAVTGEDASTKFILELVQDTEVTPKSDVPTVEKKVQENSKYKSNGGYGAGYNDVADWNIGDDVPFKLIGTLPKADVYDDYDTYKYVFHDTLSTGLTLDENSIKVYYAASKDAEGNNRTEIASTKYTVTVPGTEESNTCSFEIKFDNLKSVDGVTASDFIIVEYTATLNENAEIGLDGNPNEVFLEFSNNPNADGEGETGTTPKDKVIVFTYELDVTKVDGADATKLPNAEFKLYDKSNKWVTVDENGKVTGWVDNEADGSTLKSDTNGLFKVIGLDDGEYYLKETKAPDGYNKLQSPIKIVITATTTNGQKWSGDADEALTALTIKVDNGTEKSGDISTGKVSTEVQNNQGATLPETGGIGTRIFYAVGAVLMIGAAVLLITRKRTEKNQ